MVLLDPDRLDPSACRLAGSCPDGVASLYFGLAPLPWYYGWFVTIRIFVTTRWAKVEKNNAQPVKISQLFKTPALTSQTIALMIMTTVQIADYSELVTDDYSNWFLKNFCQRFFSLMVATILGIMPKARLLDKILNKWGPGDCILWLPALLASSVQYLSLPVWSMATMVIGGAVVETFLCR